MIQAGQQWDTGLYDGSHSYVWHFGESLLDVLNPQPGEHILDLGCGTGHLTSRLADAGAIPTGLDASAEMVAAARSGYPNLQFLLGDAADFHMPQAFDAVFSNATLHWVKRTDEAVACISESLRKGGRFVAELGAHGNVEVAINGLQEARQSLGIPQASSDQNPWFFPRLIDYASLVEKHGLEVTLAHTFDRPTRLGGGREGLHNWYRMFGSSFLSDLSEAAQEQVIRAAEERLAERLLDRDTWVADYRRLRIVAVKA